MAISADVSGAKTTTTTYCQCQNREAGKTKIDNGRKRKCKIRKSAHSQGKAEPRRVSASRA